MTVAPVDVTPEPQTPKEEVPPSLHERLESVADDYLSKAGAAEPAPTDAATDGEATPQPEGEQKTEAAAPPADTWVVPTPEQLKDKAWWGARSKEDWERLEREHPVETHSIKAAQGAASRIVNDARAERQRLLDEAQTTATTHLRTDALNDEDPSEEFVSMVEQALTGFDPKENAKNLLKVIRQASPIIGKELGVDPNENRAKVVMAEALTTAYSEFPELSNFINNEADRAALDKIADESPVLTALIETGSANNIALAMVDAGRQLAATKKAGVEKAAADKRQAEIDAKKKDLQKTVQSNARLASADVVKPNGGSAASKLPLKQRLGEVFDRVVATQK